MKKKEERNRNAVFYNVSCELTSSLATASETQTRDEGTSFDA
jgi:hypothetical protein